MGPVASGKTAFLLSILNEMKSSRADESAKFGYVPQHPFIISGSVRENILCGRAFSQTSPDVKGTGFFAPSIDQGVYSSLSDQLGLSVVLGVKSKTRRQ